MAPEVSDWKCRTCGFDRWHQVSVRRKNGAPYHTSFYACSGCSVMFLNPAQFNVHSTAAPDIGMANVVGIRARKG